MMLPPDSNFSPKQVRVDNLPPMRSLFSKTAMCAVSPNNSRKKYAEADPAIPPPIIAIRGDFSSLLIAASTSTLTAIAIESKKAHRTDILCIIHSLSNLVDNYCLGNQKLQFTVRINGPNVYGSRFKEWFNGFQVKRSPPCMIQNFAHIY